MNRFYSFIVTLILVDLSFGEKILTFTKAKCFSNQNYVVNSSCSVLHKTRDVSITNVNYDLKLPLYNVTVHMRFLKLQDSDSYKVFVINDLINICKSSKRKNILKLNFFSKTLIRLVSRYSNMIRCYHKVII